VGHSRVDFIERYLGFSPDHGDGSFEAMLLVMLVTIATGIASGFSAIGKTKDNVRKQESRN
jgi:hypothetical protein